MTAEEIRIYLSEPSRPNNMEDWWKHVALAAKDELFETRRVLALTEPYLCEMPAEVEAEVRKALQVPR